MARAAKQTLDRRDNASILVFDDTSGGPIEIDFRGTIDDVLARLPDITRGPAALDDAPPPRAVPAVRDWAWWRAKSPCCRDTGTGWRSSPAARRLRSADWSRKRGEPARTKDRQRQAREAAYRFMSVIAGNKPRYEDAIRALFAGDPVRFEKLIAGWPADVRDHASRLAERAFRRDEPARPG